MDVYRRMESFLKSLFTLSLLHVIHFFQANMSFNDIYGKFKQVYQVRLNSRILKPLYEIFNFCIDFCFLAGFIGRDPKRRSEEHTSELQSRGHLVCRLLLEKKNKRQMKPP